MEYLIVYDIVNNTTRTAISELLKDLGMRRIQWSAFFGELSKEELKHACEKIKSYLKELNDRVDIFPICLKDKKMHIKIKKYEISNEI